jgi:large subunit ribosomal protein L1
MKRSKRYKAIAEKIEDGKVYTIEEAAALLKEGGVNFDAGMELHMHLGIDRKKSDQIVRGTVVFPHSTGKTVRVAAFVGEDKVAEAKEAGADLVADVAAIEEIKKTGKCDFDVAVATPDMMRNLGKIAKILGQQGLMPNPKTETVGPDVKKMITELKAGKTAYRNDDGGNVHFLVGRVSTDATQLKENIATAVESVKKSKPEEQKGEFVESMTLSSSMGPGVPVKLG